jgi:hypothetical protein
MRRLNLPITALMTLLVTSCDGAESPSPRAAPVDGATSAAADFRPVAADEMNALPTDFSTGEPWIDEVISELVRSDVDALLGRAVWEPRECVVHWDRGPPPPPRCSDGVDEGTPVDSLAFHSGETEYVGRERLRQHLTRELAVPRHLCEVRTPQHTNEDYAIVRLRAAEIRGDDATVSDLSLRVVPDGILSVAVVREPVHAESVLCGN